MELKPYCGTKKTEIHAYDKFLKSSQKTDHEKVYMDNMKLQVLNSFILDLFIKDLHMLF